MKSAIVRDLHPLLRIDWAASGRNILPADEKDITALLEIYPDAPADYLDIVLQYDFLFLDTRPRNDPYFEICILSSEDVLAWRTWYPWLETNMVGAFFFGMHGDMSFCVGEFEKQRGVYKIQTSAAYWTEAEYLAPTIRALLCDGIGWADKGTTS